MVHKNDLLICAPQRDNEFNKIFDICARVVCVEGDICTLDRYQKFGGLRLKELACNWNEVSEYYRPMTEDEKRVFADTVFGREVKGVKIHLGGDRRYEGWEKISGDVLDTLMVLNESRSRSKDEPVLYSPDQWKYEANAQVETTADPDFYHVDGWMRIKIGEYKEHGLYVNAEVFIDEDGLHMVHFPAGEPIFELNGFNAYAMWEEHRLVCEVIYKTLADYFEANKQQEKDRYLSIISENKPDIFEDYISPLLKDTEIEDTGHDR